jgi:hypothetical protein
MQPARRRAKAPDTERDKGNRARERPADRSTSEMGGAMNRVANVSTLALIACLVACGGRTDPTAEATLRAADDVTFTSTSSASTSTTSASTHGCPPVPSIARVCPDGTVVPAQYLSDVSCILTFSCPPDASAAMTALVCGPGGACRDADSCTTSGLNDDPCPLECQCRANVYSCTACGELVPSTGCGQWVPCQGLNDCAPSACPSVTCTCDPYGLFECTGPCEIGPIQPP